MGNTRLPEVVVCFSVAVGPCSGSIADAVFHDRFSVQGPSPTRSVAAYNVCRGSVVPASVFMLTAPSSSVPERSHHMLPPTSGIPAVPSHPLAALFVGPHRFDELHDSGPSASSSFSFISEYHLRLRN